VSACSKAFYKEFHQDLSCIQIVEKNGAPKPMVCIQCVKCAKVCEAGAITQNPKTGVYMINKKLCTSCGKCAERCYAKAREIIGREASVEEVMTEVMKDKIFYDNSNGGMTISGGEPLYQPEFTLQLLQSAKAKGLHTCLDTSGSASGEIIKSVIPYTDIFLYDLKETNGEKHLEYTGVPLDVILDNLRFIDSAGAKMILRCPLIPGLNVRDSHADGIAVIANSLANLLEVNLMPYHPLGESKSEHLGKDPLFTGEFAEKKDLESFRLRIQERVKVPVKFS
jgi:pyruvate formate lyase activating enzyme